MTKTSASPKEYPALRAFMHGYLHEDYADEYGSAVEAVHEFRSDADDEEFNNVLNEWRRFIHRAKTQSIQAIQKRIHDELGGGWRPMSNADLQAVTKAFEHPREKETEEEEEEE
jgi:rRNA maturation endonuclease Nob1